MKESVFLFLMVASVYASSVLRPRAYAPVDPATHAVSAPLRVTPGITLLGGSGGASFSGGGCVNLVGSTLGVTGTGTAFVSTW